MGCLSSKPKEENVNIDFPSTEATIRSILLIQRWYRRHMELMEERRKFTWQIFQKLEYASEQDEMKLYNFFNALLQYMPTGPEQVGRGSQGSSRRSLALKEDEIDYMDIEIDDVDVDYLGVHIHSPMRRTDLDDLIHSFQKRKSPRLHAKYVSEIFKDTICRLMTLPNINEASNAISKQITIVGDLHGKLDDLFMIFHKNGLPSSGNPYIFNGDFVDRGKKSIEVFIIILSCFLVFPGSVFLNRGNHEDHLINIRYGFTAEVRHKYKEHADSLLQLIEGVYRWLPLGSIVNGKVLVVHGGIADTTDLSLIRSLDRSKFTSLLKPPLESPDEAQIIIDKDDWKQVFDILWSDPMDSYGCISNDARGAGMYFGPDVTQDFLERNDMLFIVRSHECKPDGYELQHNNKLITIFSASNYYELGSNHGAYLKLIGQKLQTQFVEYTCAFAKIKKMNVKEQVGLVESSAIKELTKQIQANRDELEAEFRKYDPHDIGIITAANWCKVMKHITGLNINWLMLHEKVVKVEPVSRRVIYMSTFDDISPELMKSSQACQGLVDTLYENKSNLETIFRIIDKDNSGYITVDEFSDACTLLRQYMPNPLSHEEMMQICEMMDIDKDGVVTLNEFLETFRLVSEKFKGH